MKIAGTLLLLLALAPGPAAAYLIDYTGNMDMNKIPDDNGDPARAENLLIPFEVVADTESQRFLTMSIWIDGHKLTDYVDLGDPDAPAARWTYYDGMGFWNKSGGVMWQFEKDSVSYLLDWVFVEIQAPADINPIKEFHNFVEGPWYLGIDEGSYRTDYGMAGPGQNFDLVGTPRQVPEPATLSLLALGLAAIGIRRRLR